MIMIFMKYFVSIGEVNLYWQKKSRFAMRWTEIKGVANLNHIYIHMNCIIIHLLP